MKAAGRVPLKLFELPSNLCNLRKLPTRSRVPACQVKRSLKIECCVALLIYNNVHPKLF